MYKGLQVCAVVPARDEAEAIGAVVAALNAGGLVDRIIVCDNGSRDATAAIARGLGAETVEEPCAGYGAACQGALSAIGHCDVVVFVDADDSLQLDEMPALLDAIADGADLAVGVRARARCEKGSMTVAQQLGNRVASRLIRLIWRQPVSDLGPFRAIRFEQLDQLRLRDRRFGWNVEMQIRAIQHRLKCVEVPIHYRRRIGRSKISGTPRGVALAAYDMIGTILWLAVKPAPDNRPDQSTDQ
jgi:glycosyltransferase involved in cell wall biosynthesis